MSKNFESWVFSVNFGSSDLYLKHSPFMKIAYNARNEEIDSLKKEVERLSAIITRGDEIKNNWENNCYQEAVHYNWLDDQIESLKKEVEILRSALEVTI